jgi:hypothetical protein
MEAKFILTPEDLMAFEKHQVNFGRKKPFEPPLSFIIVPFGLSLSLFALIVLAQPPAGSFKQLFGLGMVFGLLVASALFMGLKTLSIPSPGKLQEDQHNQWVFAPQRLTIAPEGITIQRTLSTTTHQWPVVWKIESTEDHVFFFDTSTSAIIVPKRAFADKRHFEGFVALARVYQQGLTPDELIGSRRREALTRPTAIFRPHKK